MLVRFRMRSALGSDSRCIFLWIWREKDGFVTLSQKYDTYKELCDRDFDVILHGNKSYKP